MKYLYRSSVIILVFFLSSCIEIIDDLSIKNDGSGTWKYTINLSSSKVKINSILALDSLEGKKVPSISEIDQRIQAIKKKLASKPGISSVTLDANYTDYVFKLSCDFHSLAQLQAAVKEIALEESKDKSIPQLDHTWISWDGTKLSRSIPDVTIKKLKELKSEEIELLKQGSYTSITRFERLVDKFDNPSAVLSKNKLAVMLKSNPWALAQNPNLLENTIYLVQTKN